MPSRTSENCCITLYYYFGKIPKTFRKKLAKNSAEFQQILQIFVNHQQQFQQFSTKKLRLDRERCKGVHCVDLGESFPTSIYLEKFGLDTAENGPLIGLSFSCFLLFRGCFGQVLFSSVFDYGFQKRCKGVRSRRELSNEY